MNLSYLLVLIVQILCVFHAVKNNKSVLWVIILILVPVFSCIAYVLTQMLNKQDIHSVQKGVGAMINPKAKLQELEKKVEISDSFENKVNLADAYFNLNQFEEAIVKYESCLQGNFKTDSYVLTQCGLAYFEFRNFEKAVDRLKLAYSDSSFKRSKAHLAYALSLDEIGKTNEAFKEFELMNSSSSYIELRYQYALFLLNHDKKEEACSILELILKEIDQMDNIKKAREGQWLKKSSALLEKIKS